MKKILVPLISIILFLGTLKLLQSSKANRQLLGQREREVLSLLAEGYTDNEIAVRLHTGQRTIEKYQSKILKRLHVHDASSALRYAIEKGLVSITYA